MSPALQIRVSVTTTRPGFQGGADADPHGFIGVLMDGALERIRQAREHMALGAPQSGPSRLLRTARLILGELRVDLDLSAGGAIAANLDDLYDYMSRRLRAADLTDARGGQLVALDEVSHLLDALRAAWAFMPAEVRKASRN